MKNDPWAGWENIFKNITKQDNGCWLWQGPVNKFGLPMGSINGKTVTVSKAIFYKSNPLAVKTKRKLKIKCENNNCVAPIHLYQINFDETVLKYFEQNKTLKEISAECDMSVASIERTLRRLNLSKQAPHKGVFSKIEDYNFSKRFKRLYLSNSNQNVAKKLNISRGTVRVFAKKLKLQKTTNQWKFSEHPKGMLGKNHSEENKLRSKINATKMWQNEEYRRRSKEWCKKNRSAASLRMIDRIKNHPMGIYSNAKRGKREDLGEIFFRSRWEANYARYLNLLIEQGEIIKWEFEADIFYFEKIKRGVRSYCPDFKITLKSNEIEYHEIKGWMDKKSATKIKRMRIYYPKIKLIVICEKQYKELEKRYKNTIKYWENKGEVP